MQTPDGTKSIEKQIRGFVEAYTPDRTIGRTALAAITGPVGIYSLLLAFGFLINFWIGSFLIVPMAALLGIILVITTLLTLWPVYLSAIGQVDSPEEYLCKLEEEDKWSSIEQLKVRYQHGEFTEEEFEREVEAALNRPSSKPDENLPTTDQIDELIKPERNN